MSPEPPRWASWMIAAAAPSRERSTIEGDLAEGFRRRVDSMGSSGARDIAYEDGRVTGRAIVPSAAGLDTVEVDAAVPESSIDDDALVALFPTMELAPGMLFTLPVFAAGKNELHDNNPVTTRGPHDPRAARAPQRKKAEVGGG